VADVAAWLESYFHAWETNDPSDVRALFAEDAVYSYGPFREPARGRDAIVANWVAGAPQPDLRWAYEVLAASGRTGIAHFAVSWSVDDTRRVELDGILQLRFDGQGRCLEHREWYAEREVPSEGG
jgi:hypothetical protein